MGTGPKTADAEFQLTGCQLILLPQHTGTDDHDFFIQVIVIGNGGTVLVGQGCHINALKFGLQYLYTGFLRLFRQPIRKELDDFAVIVTDHDPIVECRNFVLLAVGAHVAFLRFGIQILPKDDFPVPDAEFLDDLIAAGHSFFIFHFLPPFFHKSPGTAVCRRWRKGGRSAGLSNPAQAGF